MVASQALLIDRKRPSIERLSLGQPVRVFEKRGKVVQLLEKRKISGEESIELVGAVGDRNDKH